MGDVRDAGPAGVPEVPGAGTIEDVESALHAFMRVFKQARLHEFLLKQSGIDLDRAGAALLYVLYEEPASLRVSELAERLHVDAPAVSRKVQQLERAGLVGRSGDLADRRASRLQLTDSGRAAIGATMRARRDWLSAVLSGWTAAEQADFARSLRRLTDGVDRHLEESDV